MTDARAAAADVAAAVAPRAPEIESARRLPADIVAAIATRGLFKLCVPTRYGGGAADPLTIVDVIETMARADGAAGWCLMIGATSGFPAGWLEPAIAAEVYGPEGAIAGGVLAPRGTAVASEDGSSYVVDGRWPFASGCQHSTWLMGGCLIDGQPGATALFPAEAAAVIDTWTVSGLRGTGSHDIEVRSLTVPAAHVIRLTGPPVDDGPLYRMPVFGLLAAGIAAVSLGIAHAALDSFTQLAATKTATGHHKTLGQRAAVQADLARAHASVRSARAYLHDAIDGAWRQANAGERVGLDSRGELRMAATHAATASAAAVSSVYTLAGGTAVYADHPLQRHFRDAHVATQHMMVGPATWELAGRVLLGADINTSEL